MPSFAAIGEVITRWLRLFEQPRVRKLALAIALVIFVIGLVVSIRESSVSLSSLRLQPLLASLLLGLPAMMAALAVDFVLQARFAGAQVSFSRALEVVVVGSAANMLPIPGGAAIRAANIKSRGGSLRKAAYAVALFPGQTLGIALLYAAWLLDDFNRGMGVIFLIFGLLTAGICSALIYRLAVKPSTSLAVSTLLMKVLLVLLSAALIYWSFGALGISVTLQQAAVFVLASLVAVLVWIVPGGLGIQELVSAALAPLVGLDPAQGFLGATVMRCVALVGILPFALWFLSRRPQQTDIEVN